MQEDAITEIMWDDWIILKNLMLIKIDYVIDSRERRWHSEGWSTARKMLKQFSIVTKVLKNFKLG